MHHAGKQGQFETEAVVDQQVLEAASAVIVVVAQTSVDVRINGRVRV